MLPSLLGPTNPLWFLGAMIRSAVTFPRTALPVAGRVVINQVRFTCVQALPLLAAIAVLVAIPLMLRVGPLAASLGFADTFDRLLVAVVVQEIGPLVPAILVAARSGTAVAAEVATATVLGEREALEALGIDGIQFYVIPRVVGFGISVTLLALFFDAMVLGAIALNRSSSGAEALYLESLRATVTGADILVTLVKGFLFGGGIAALCSLEGLAAGSSATRIPISVSRGTVRSLLWVLAASAVFAAGRFLL